MDNYQKLIADFVNQACQASGLTPSALGLKVGVAASTLNRAGKTNNLMSLRTAWKISEFTGVQIPQVASGNPGVGDSIYDADEAAWVRFWRSLLPNDRTVMFKTHRIDPPGGDQTARKTK